MGNSNNAWFFRVKVGSTYLTNDKSVNANYNFEKYYVGPIFGYNTGGKHTIVRCFWGTNYLPGNLTTSSKVTCKDIYDGVTTSSGGYGTGSGSNAYKDAYASYGVGKSYLGTISRSYSTAKTITAHLNYTTDGNTMPSGAKSWSTSNNYGGTNGSSQKLVSPDDVKY